MVRYLMAILLDDGLSLSLCTLVIYDLKMALSVHRLARFSINICNAIRSGVLLKTDPVFSKRIVCKISHASVGKETRDPANYFFENNVQELLYDICGDDYDKIFRVRKLGETSLVPMYKFLTDEELKEEIDALDKKRKELLQFPPVLLPRKEIDVVLSKDPKLQGLEKSKIIFTDITYGKDDANRLIVARDPDGTLRQATWDERHRMNCIYFPCQGKDLEVPRLFQPENLKNVLERKEYEFVLDKACVQFEPNDPLYIEVTSKVYDEVNKKNDFEILYSTRHYGSLAFYLAFSADIDNILAHSIERRRISAAASLVKLLHIIHPVSTRTSQIESESSPESIIEAYVGSDPKAKESLKLKWRNYIDNKNM